MQTYPDISHYETVNDWKALAASTPFIIMKATQGRKVDAKLADTVKNCEKYGIPYWCYGYLNKGEELSQAKFLVETVKPLAGAHFMGYALDAEDSNEAAALKEALTWIRTQSGKILLYTGWRHYGMYKDVIASRGASCAWWEARYRKEDDGTYHPEHPCHDGVDLYQFTEKGSFPGIAGSRIDLNVLTGTLKEGWFTTKEEGMYKTVEEAMDALETVLLAEEGYLEKKDKTAKYLDHKTKNAGTKNFTKYWRDINNWRLFKYAAGWAGGDAWYWCAAFQYWGFVQAYGLEKAELLLLHAPFISCATLGNKSKAAGQLKSVPKRGDLALFYRDSKKGFGHVEWVTKVDTTAKKFWTIGGNTSGGTAVVANGGAVVAGKSYSYDGTKTRFHRPDYAGVLGITDKEIKKPTPSVNTAEENIAAGQRWLNKYYKDLLKNACGATLKVDGVYGEKTRAACLAVWKDVMNRKHGTKLNPANTNFLTSCRASAGKAAVSANSVGTFTLIAQLILSALGYYTGAMDAACGALLVEAITAYQKDRKISADGVCGRDTWYKLFN